MCSVSSDGEVDCRGTYTVLAIARITNILTSELTEGVAEYLLTCQSYEGGFGGAVDNECHGGYNFCALAALHILGKVCLSVTVSIGELKSEWTMFIRRKTATCHC